MDSYGLISKKEVYLPNHSHTTCVSCSSPVLWLIKSQPMVEQQYMVLCFVLLESVPICLKSDNVVLE